jgi:hypothetical protein
VASTAARLPAVACTSINPEACVVGTSTKRKKLGMWPVHPLNQEEGGDTTQFSTATGCGLYIHQAEASCGWYIHCTRSLLWPLRQAGHKSAVVEEPPQVCGGGENRYVIQRAGVPPATNALATRPPKTTWST